MHVFNIVNTLFGSGTSLFGLIAGTESLLTQLKMNGYRRVVECLVVGITEYKTHVVDTLTIHVVNGITATATDTDYFDDAILLFGLTEIE
jgi:hypothetical protein